MWSKVKYVDTTKVRYIDLLECNNCILFGAGE